MIQYDPYTVCKRCVLVVTECIPYRVLFLHSFRINVKKTIESIGIRFFYHDRYKYNVKPLNDFHNLRNALQKTLHFYLLVFSCYSKSKLSKQKQCFMCP